ncbi:MAG: 5-formyltetrahydrofolate cyclo-ligase [Balneolaceae bacterium]|nr:5-formyltetrahydrofolate cyclo-ligase [Balneolaceae bacterium]
MGPPEQNREVASAELDLVIVPMVGADLQCNRLGHGKGYYDRFLANVKGMKVGLCYEACIVESLPTESFDVPLDAVVSESRIIKSA